MGRKERREQKRKRRNLIVSIVFIFLMVFGFTIAGVIYNPQAAQQNNNGNQQQQPQTLKYNGIDFKSNGNYYTATIQGKQRSFFLHPLDVETLYVPPEAMSALKNTQYFTVTFNPNSPNINYYDLARYDLSSNLDKTVLMATTKNSSQYKFNVVNCSKATPQAPIIYLNDSNATSITYNNGCVSVNGDGAGIIRGTERVIYGMLGVING